ncbi:MAG TPA: hypothetical protein VGG45_16495 [Terracidiphilus sp.]|jgi:hypothetical protein
MKAAIVIACLTLTACGTMPLIQIGPSTQQPPPVVNVTVPSACGWEMQFYPDDGYSSRWTRGEKIWLVAHNLKVAANCPPAPTTDH